MTLRIDSADGAHYAILEDDAAGIAVSVWRAATIRQCGTRLARTVIDCPWHVACDRVYDIMRQVTELPTTNRTPTP